MKLEELFSFNKEWYKLPLVSKLKLISVVSLAVKSGVNQVYFGTDEMQSQVQASCLSFYFILPFWNDILIRQVPISSYSLFCLISVSLALKWYTMVFVWFTFLSGQTSTSTVSFNICTVPSWLGLFFLMFALERFKSI